MWGGSGGASLPPSASLTKTAGFCARSSLLCPLQFIGPFFASLDDTNVQTASALSDPQNPLCCEGAVSTAAVEYRAMPPWPLTVAPVRLLPRTPQSLSPCPCPLPSPPAARCARLRRQQGHRLGQWGLASQADLQGWRVAALAPGPHRIHEIFRPSGHQRLGRD